MAKLTRDELLARGRRVLKNCRKLKTPFSPSALARQAGGGNYLPIGRYWPTWGAYAGDCGARESDDVQAHSGIIDMDRSGDGKRMRREREAEPSFARAPAALRRLERAKNFVVTCAQNNTEPEADFLRTLERLAEEREAQLLVIPVRYKNPTSRRDPQEDDRRDSEYWWHSAFAEYLIEDELHVHPLLRIMGNVRIAATSADPLSSRVDSRTKAESAIYGHPQLRMKTVATPHQRLPKILWTTGAATQKNYSRTQAGDLADFHHSHAATIVEVRGDRFHTREVNWSGSDLYDLDRRYTPNGSEPSPGVAALVMGDTHERYMDYDVAHATFGSGGIVSTLQPENVVQHDVLDGIAINPHEAGRKLSEAVRAMREEDNLERELLSLAKYLVDTDAMHTGETIIVSSNHDDFLMRWLQRGEAAVLPQNRELYAWLTYKCLEHARLNGGQLPNPLELWFKERVGEAGRHIRFLHEDESFQVLGVELGMHGHLGPNGSRGTVRNLSRIGTRSIIGHSHSPGIYQGCYQVGTSSELRLGYNRGPSSWLHAHAVVHPNGKRQMIPIIHGRWRG